MERTPTDNEKAHGDVVGPEKGSILKKIVQAAECIEGDWERARRFATD